MIDPRVLPPATRAQDSTFVRQCSFQGLQGQLPLRWPTPSGVPESPKKQYRSHYEYPGCDGLDDRANWETVSAFDLILRLVDFSGLRPVLASLLGWTSARGQVPFDPVSMFLLISWRLVNGWKRSTALDKIKQPRYADYARLFGFHDGDFPTEGGLRYFLTTIGRNSDAHGETVSVAVDKERAVDITIQCLRK